MATTNRGTAGGQPPKSKQPIGGNAADPLDVNQRLYVQLGKLLDDLEAADREERMTLPQRISALIAIGRVQVLFNNIRKGGFDDGRSGSEIRRYAAAFAKTNDSGGRTKHPRSADIIDFDSVSGDYDDSDGD